MRDRVMIEAGDIRRCLDEESLRDWLVSQRWYASKSRHLSGVAVVEGLILREAPELYLALVQTRFATGTHEIYQLPLAFAQGDEPGPGDPIARADGWTAYDALADPAQAVELLHRMQADWEVETDDGRFGFHRVDGLGDLRAGAPTRLIGVEQSNSSIVFDERVVLKLFRKLEPGINPELEVLAFLTRAGFRNIAPLRGWYDYEGAPLSSTLGVAQQFFPDAQGGWELALGQIESEPQNFLVKLGALGAVTAAMHTTLASDATDPAFSPEQPSQEALSLLTATIDEDIERIFLRLPDDDRLAPIAGRGQDVRERLAMRAQVGVSGRVIRTHGDYHLGQTLYTPRGWVIIDFEGEPARPLYERRQKRSPLRDVASMLRSFAYVTSAVSIMHGRQPPPDFEEHARTAFLSEYLTNVESTLMPGSEAAVENLLSIYELEKAIYELRYELDNRPDWVSIPVAGIRRLLDS